jgi:hypothetical protein
MGKEITNADELWILCWRSKTGFMLRYGLVRQRRGGTNFRTLAYHP